MSNYKTMCGILAISGNTSKNIDDAKIGAMLSTLSHRGPDDMGFVRIGPTVLGQTRLSIVDLASGHQPMRDAEHPVTIVFNGEIYGYKETRARLEALGHSFKTSSDTEVILKAYIQYGSTCVDHLDGMFAFAIWDEDKEELFIARDRFGKKPFYYYLIDGTFVGASEMKSIFATGLVKGKIDPQALDDYLRLMYIPPHKTIYSNIQTLPPAHVGIIKNGVPRVWRYWQLQKKEQEISYNDAKSRIKELFDVSVKKRMVADVEIGSLLSGGVDSTLVTHYAQKYSPEKKVKTFAVGYGNYKNELPYALEASQKIGTDHYPLLVDRGDVLELKNVISYFDEPHGDSSDYPQHLISKLASSKVKVALSGDGADELFMGYGWYQKYWHTPLYKRIFQNPFSAYKKMTEVFSKKERVALLKQTVLSNEAYELTFTKKVRDYFDKINTLDLHMYLPGQLLTKVDRTGMMHSLEVRSPFLDTALAEFVYSLPMKYKTDKNQNKIILKDILSEIMPKEFVERRKQGFGAPIQGWLKEKSMRDELHKILTTENHQMYKYIEKDAVRNLLGSVDHSGKASSQKIWSILCLVFWFELHKNDYE